MWQKVPVISGSPLVQFHLFCTIDSKSTIYKMIPVSGFSSTHSTGHLFHLAKSFLTFLIRAENASEDCLPPRYVFMSARSIHSETAPSIGHARLVTFLCFVNTPCDSQFVRCPVSSLKIYKCPLK